MTHILIIKAKSFNIGGFYGYSKCEEVGNKKDIPGWARKKRKKHLGSSKIRYIYIYSIF